jgi:cytochrome c oxidase subunit II
VSCLRVGALAGIVLALPTACAGSSKPDVGIGTPLGGQVQTWARQERLPPAALPGARVFATAGCTACHTYAGSGHANLGAPDLTAYGRRRLGVAFDIHFLRCPSCVKPGSPMPRFDVLGRKRLRQLAVFLEASKGIR